MIKLQKYIVDVRSSLQTCKTRNWSKYKVFNEYCIKFEEFLRLVCKICLPVELKFNSIAIIYLSNINWQFPVKNRNFQNGFSCKLNQNYLNYKNYEF